MHTRLSGRLWLTGCLQLLIIVTWDSRVYSEAILYVFQFGCPMSMDFGNRSVLLVYIEYHKPTTTPFSTRSPAKIKWMAKYRIGCGSVHPVYKGPSMLHE